MKTPEKFWWVWRLNGGLPTKHHPTKEEATLEAERLARSLPGEAFYVLEAVSFSRRVDVVTLPLGTSDDGISF